MDDDNEADDQVLVGDMVLKPKQYNYLYSNDSSKRHGLRLSFNHWPNGKMPYRFADDLEEDVKETVLRAMDYIAEVSCLRFKVAHDGIDHVMIRNGHGCSSNVGNLRSGRQYLTLSPHCKLGNVIHEILHSLGFLHMVRFSNFFSDCKSHPSAHSSTQRFNVTSL
jgi:Astacin (Peptidase family M12A)